MKESKSKSYVLRAQTNYRKKFDQIALRLPKGSSDIIREKTGKSVNSYVSELVINDIKNTYGVDLKWEAEHKNDNVDLTPAQTVNQVDTPIDADELRKLKALFDEGIITQGDFETKKKQLLGL